MQSIKLIKNNKQANKRIKKNKNFQFKHFSKNS